MICGSHNRNLHYMGKKTLGNSHITPRRTAQGNPRHEAPGAKFLC